MTERPTKVNILGTVWSIKYIQGPSKNFGTCDYESCTITIHYTHRPDGAVWQVIWHEILHALDHSLHLGLEHEGDEEHNNLDRLATGINDVLIRNGWIK